MLRNNTVQESEPSETILVWTEPTVKALVEPPKVTPSEIREGDDIQVSNRLCYCIHGLEKEHNIW